MVSGKGGRHWAGKKKGQGWKKKEYREATLPKNGGRGTCPLGHVLKGSTTAAEQTKVPNGTTSNQRRKRSKEEKAVIPGTAAR